jgi:hypothetical protein
MAELLAESLPAVLLAAAFAATPLVALRLNAKPWVLLLLGSLPALVLYVWNPCVRIYLAHGFYHTSIVYQILNGDVPPMNALLGGEPQLYPWAHALLTAGVVKGLHLPPPAAFAALNLLALLGTLVLVFRIAMLLSANRGAAVLAALLSVFGLTFLNQGPIASLAQRFTGPEIFEWRALVADKFTNVNAMPLGFLFFALFLHSILVLLCRPDAGRRHDAMLFLSVVGTGHLYPLFWTALVAAYVGLCAAVLSRRGREAWPAIGRTLFAVALGTVALLPYLRQLSSGKVGTSFVLLPGSGNRDASFVLAPSLEFVSLRALRAIVTLSPLAVLLAWKRRALARLWRSNPVGSLALAAVAATLVLLYILLSVTPSLANEYKYLMLACVPLGLFGGFALQAVRDRSGLVCFLLLAALLLPFGANWLGKFVWDTCTPLVEGVHLRHRDPARDELYRWIGERTERDALFLDSELTVPVFGRRQLYIGLGDRFQEGWTVAPHDTLTALHYPPRVVDARTRLARNFYLPAVPEIHESVVAELRRTSGGRDVYVVARERTARSKLERSPAFEAVFENDVAAVHRLLAEEP